MWAKILIGLLFFSSAISLNAQDGTHYISNWKKNPFSLAKKDTLIKIKGNVSVYSSAYNMDGNTYRRPPFFSTFSGNPVISIKGIEIPTRIILGKQQSHFYQPFNQIGISPRYKQVTLHLGYRNLNFSPFTLGGHTFLGTGIEFNPSKWKLAFMYGRMRKAIEEDPLLPYDIHTTYRRIGYGGYIGYRNKKNLMAFSFFRARDDTSSLEKNIINNSNHITPSDNIAAAVQSRQYFGTKHSKRELIWETEWAVSAYNNDYRAQPMAPYQIGLWKPFTGLFRPTSSMRLATAGHTSFTFKGKDFSARMRYRRIDPEYMSMGAYYFQTDIEDITLEPAWKMWKNKLRIQSSIGWQKDNLHHQRQATTKRTIGSVHLSFTPNAKYALDAQFSNYGITQRAGRNPLNDTLRMVQANRNLSITNRYCVIDERKSQTVLFLLNYQQVSDLNAFTSLMNNSKIFFGNLTFMQVWIPLNFTMTTSIHHTTFSGYTGRQLITGVTYSISKVVKDQKLTYNNSVSFFSTVNQTNWNFSFHKQRSTLITLYSGVQYKINRHHHLNGNVNSMIHRATAQLSFSEITAGLGYSYNF